MEPAVAESSDLDNFIEFLYGGLEGYIYIAAKNPLNHEDFTPEMLHYPSEAAVAKAIIKQFSKTHEVYIAPAIFKTKEGRGQKENVKASNVAWVDFDGNAPAEWSDFASGKGIPSLVLQSSIDGHNHVYWRLENPLTNVSEIERINRGLAYNFQADASGWDANQILRPPDSFNHKRSAPVRVLSSINVSYDVDLFNVLPTPPPPTAITEWKLSELPDVDTVLLKYAMGPDVIKLLTTDKPSDRSAALQQMAYATAELGLADNEIFVILRNLDGRWGKYVGRPDRDRRLADIIVRARSKYPSSNASPLQEQSPLSAATSTESTFAYGYEDFLNTEITIDGVIQDILMERGQMMFVGPSGVGKTQFILDAMKHIALGKDFLGFKVCKPKKIGFLSLEMGHPDLQIFMKAQHATLTAEESSLLQENLIIIPLGEAWPLNVPDGQARFTQVLEHFKFEGVFIDSVGSSVLGDISANAVVQPLLNYADQIRNQFELFLWFIHHTRKAQQGGKPGYTLDDVYGDQYLVNRSSSSFALLPAKEDRLKVRTLKSRLAKKLDDFYLERTPELTFKRVAIPTTSALPGQPKNEDDEPPTTTAGGFVL